MVSGMKQVKKQPATARRLDIVDEAFRGQPDGSWTSVRVSDVGTPDGTIRIGAGMVFRIGTTLCGIDVAELLEERRTTREAG